MKKMLMLSLMAISISLFLSGCEKNYDIEDKNFVLVLGIDKSETENVYVFTYSFADLSGYRGEKGDTVGSKVYSVNAASLNEAGILYEENNYRELDYGHIKAIVFGAGMLEDSESIYDLSYEMWKDNSFSKTVSVFIGENTAAQIVALDEEMTESLGQYLRGMMEREDFTECDLSNVIDVYFGNKELVEIEVIKIKDGLPCRDYSRTGIGNKK